MNTCCECKIVQTANDKCHLCKSKSSRFGPLGSAYAFRSLHYNLAYHAFNELAASLESDNRQAEGLANEFGVTVDDLLKALEELYTNNADPDNPDIK